MPSTSTAPQPPPASQPPSAPPPSLFPASTVQHVAQTSLSLAPLRDNVATSLAADTEHRLHLILQDAAKFMRHGRREKLTTEDVKRALEIRGMEPIYGFLPNSSGSTVRQPHFRRTMTSTGIVYTVEEEEIDLEQVAKRISSDSRSVPIRKGGVGWKAHWLAIEGVQPLIPENPTPQEIAKILEEERGNDGGSVGATTTTVDLALSAAPPTNGAIAAAPVESSSSTAAAATNATSQPLVKHILSRELQVYYQRLTEAILHGVVASSDTDTEVTDATSLAAISSLRSDPGLHQLVPYLAQWISTNVTSALGGQDKEATPTGGSSSSSAHRHNLLQRMTSSIEALLLNPHIGIETYIHLLLPPLLSTILISLPTTEYEPSLRVRAAGLLSYILRTFAPSYPSIKPRITRVLLEALYSGTTSTSDEDESTSTSTSTTPLPTKLGALIALRTCGGGMARAVIRARSQPLSGGRGDDSTTTTTSAQHFGSAFVALGQWVQKRQQAATASEEDIAAFVDQVRGLLYDVAEGGRDAEEHDGEDHGGEDDDGESTHDMGSFWTSAIGSDDAKAQRGWRLGLSQV